MQAALVLISEMLSLTLFQIATMDSDDFARSQAALFPPDRIRQRGDIGLMLAFTAPFLAYFLAASRHHLDSPSAWQAVFTSLAFPLLLLWDGPSRAPSLNARVILNASYLGLAGSLFMATRWGWAMALAVAAAALARAFRLARP